MLFFTQFTHFSAEVQEANKNMDNTAQKLEMLGLVDEAQAILTDKTKDLNGIGHLLDTTWRLKRQTGNKVSTDSIDILYERGIKAGALGGKLLGAGGGGFLLFYVEQDRQEKVRVALQDLMYVPFEFEDGGTRVIYYAPESYEPKDNLPDQS